MFELRPVTSYWCYVAFVSYGINLLFFTIAFCTNHWCYFRLNGNLVNLGLWTGCWSTSPADDTVCSKTIYDDKIFTSASGKDWYIGARILMTCSLISILLQEFALICLLCIKEVEKYRERLVGAVMGFSVAVVLLLILNILITGPEAVSFPEGRVGWSFGITFFCVLFEAITGVAIFMERRDRRNNIPKSKTQNYFGFSSPNHAVNRIPTVSSYEDSVSYMYEKSTENLSYPSGSYYHISDGLSVDTVSTDVVTYSEEPGKFKREDLEWEV